MKKNLWVGLVIMMASISGNARAENVFKIEIGKDYKGYSNADMQRRIWELENAVFQLQQRVFQLESAPIAVEIVPEWICTINAMGDKYTGVGASKALATAKVIEHCKRGQKDGGFFLESKLY